MVMMLDESVPGTYCWSFSISLEELPALLKSFRDKEPDTEQIEQQAQHLVKCGFQLDELQKFIKSVCRWGGYPGIAARVINQNKPPDLRNCFVSAHALAKTAGDDIGAITRLCEVSQLALSFASKHLKFLAPDSAVVLDSIISNRLDYPMTPLGYKAFLYDCRSICKAALDRDVTYPGWGPNGWRISDVEIAIWEKLTPDRWLRPRSEGA